MPSDIRRADPYILIAIRDMKGEDALDVPYMTLLPLFAPGDLDARINRGAFVRFTNAQGVDVVRMNINDRKRAKECTASYYDYVKSQHVPDLSKDELLRLAEGVKQQPVPKVAKVNPKKRKRPRVKTGGPKSASVKQEAAAADPELPAAAASTEIATAPIEEGAVMQQMALAPVVGGQRGPRAESDIAWVLVNMNTFHQTPPDPSQSPLRPVGHAYPTSPSSAHLQRGSSQRWYEPTVMTAIREI